MERATARVVMICVASAFAILLADSFIPLGVAGGVPYIVVILLAARHPDCRFILAMAVFTTLLTVLGYGISPPGGEAWKVYFNRGLALFAIWTTAVLLYQKKIEEQNTEAAIEEREKALYEIKILKGMLPICASCKKIRDPQGEWHPLETFIQRNSEASFSHGICPECTETLYPDFGAKKK